MEITIVDLHTRENHRESSISKILSRYADVCTLHLFSSESSESPFELLESCDAIVLSGSNSMKIYGDARVRGLKSILVNLASEGVSLLGICGGNQVLASTFGFRRFVLKEPEVGWHSIHITEYGGSDPLFFGLKGSFLAFESHILAVRCDDKTRVLADNENCIQVIRYNSNTCGIQFHPEVYTRSTIDDSGKTKIDEKGDIKINTMVQENAGQRIFENFVEMTKN
ncbi:MAG: hypothetical protein QG670_1053 [Thermoproteota archaeon]|nr:hypothetical protein [Thermoproteota archaeon]